MSDFANTVEAMFDPTVKKAGGRDSKKNSWQNMRMKNQSKSVKETVEDADVHLQNAHDSLASAITKGKRSGKDVAKLEKLRASLADHLKSLASKE